MQQPTSVGREASHGDEARGRAVADRHGLAAQLRQGLDEFEYRIQFNSGR
jgi:hypothetical protein